MARDNSHYIIEGLEVFQPMKLSAELHLDFTLGNVYKYLFRCGRKNGVQPTADLSKAMNCCEDFIKKVLPRNNAIYQNGLLMSKASKEDEALLCQYLFEWQEKMINHIAFRENELMKYFIDTIIGYYIYHTKKTIEMQFIGMLDIAIAEIHKGNPVEYLKCRITNLYTRIGKEIDKQTIITI